MIRPFLPALAAALTLASCAAQPALAQSYNGGQLPNGLTYRGAVAGSDVIPCQPNGSATVKGCLASDMAAYATTSVTAFGAKCDGTTDDTTAFSNALAAGGKITIPAAVCIVQAGTLNLLVAGTDLEGAGMLDDGLGGVGTILRAKSGTSGYVLTIGSSNSAVYTRGVQVRNLAIDLTNLSDTSTNGGTLQQNSWEDNVENVRVVNYGNSKVSFALRSGAYSSVYTNVAGGIASYQGSTTGGNETTTISFVNSWLTKLNTNYAFGINFYGGAIQAPYSASTVVWLPAGTTPYASYPPNTAGEYVAVTTDIANTQSSTFAATDFEQAGGYPTPTSSGCTGVTTAWAYNDGTHGCASLYPVIKVESTAVNTTLINPNMAGIYVLDYGSNTRVVGQNCCGSWKAIDLHAGTYINTGNFICSGTITGTSNLAQFMSYAADVTSTFNCATGIASYAGLSVQPTTNVDRTFDLYDASGRSLVDFATNVPQLAFNYGLGLCGYSDNFTTLDWCLYDQSGASGTGQLVIYGSGTSQISLSGSNGTIVATGGLQSSPVGSGTPSTGAFTTLSATTSLSLSGKLVASAAAPTVSSGFSTGTPTVAGSTTAAFTVTLGSSPGSTGVLTLPTASSGWVCLAQDRTTTAATVKQSGSSTTSATFALASTVASDVIGFQCMAY